MFYSQFILAKKGPLGTIWIAAHLERKLRKNQVADTDIGVSVDSILFPEVPIALRLSSHLLLGVVRIYSRKVNYLFDDCSEALLKIKQAFRSTAVDLPPEESTAPYHSITLPETFDLDDFELPDSENFQGNYVDHHVSTREQITLQDTMDGVVFSTSQFGLDERFGDGDTSQIGLDLEEDLFLDKVAALGHGGDVLGLDADETQASVQPATPIKMDEVDEGTAETLEVLPNDDSISQINELAASTHYVENDHVPSTPGLVEEPNLSNAQEALALEVHTISEDYNSAQLVVKNNLGNASSNSDHHLEDRSAVNCSMVNDSIPDTGLSIPTEGNGYILDVQENKQMKSLGGSHYDAETMVGISPDDALVPSLPSPVLSEREPHSLEPKCMDQAGNLQDGIRSSEVNACSTHLTVSEDAETLGVRLDETVTSPGVSGVASVFVDHCGKPYSISANVLEKASLNSTCPPGSENILEIVQISYNNVEGARDVEDPCSPSSGVPSSAVCLLESAGTAKLEKIPAQPFQEQNSVVPEELSPSHVHMLQPCNSHLNGVDMFPQEGANSGIFELPAKIDGQCSLETFSEEKFHASGACADMQDHATDIMKQVSEAKKTVEVNSCEDDQANNSKVPEKLEDAVSRDVQSENFNRSASSDLPVPEKMLTVPEGLAELPNDLLMESTPDKEVHVGSEVDGAGIKFMSGKKRSLTESTLTQQSLNSIESFESRPSKRTVESIPDDDDLLSSILVGRKSSVLKLKPTPPPLDVPPMKRLRSASRVSASKRKVLMDDSMILHGDVIRQQLTSTVDIRRVRKKAPCTSPDIWKIQKQILEDEIFNEPISTGMSMELIFLHGQTHDLSGTRVSQSDENNASVEAEKDMEVAARPNATEETGVDGSTGSSAVRNDEGARPAETPVQAVEQQSEDHALDCCCNDTQVQAKVSTDLSECKISQEGLGETSVMEIDGGRAVDHAITVAVEPSSPHGPVDGYTCNISSDSTLQSLLNKASSADDAPQMDALCSFPDQNLDTQPADNDDASVVDLSNGKGPGNVEVADTNVNDTVTVGAEFTEMCELLWEGTQGGGLAEGGADLHSICCGSVDIVNPSLATVSMETSECNNLASLTEIQGKEEVWKSEPGVIPEDEVTAGEGGYDNKNTIVSHIITELPEVDTSYSVEPGVDMKAASMNDEKHNFLNDGENCGSQKVERQPAADAECTDFNHPAVEDHGDLENIIIGHDTEFLNVDDDEVAEEDDGCMPSAEETQLLENSGWSSRTRAVAKYLQILFDKEAERGKKVLPMDNLLVGKTRKEASRMFFETLVLKTRDYIHVEQDMPFDNIYIKPRGKLMKSDF